VEAGHLESGTVGPGDRRRVWFVLAIASWRRASVNAAG
jgi:hypothetical protein